MAAALWFFAAAVLLLLSLTSTMAAPPEEQAVCQHVNECGNCIDVCSHGDVMHSSPEGKDCTDCMIEKGDCAALCPVLDPPSCKTRCQLIASACMTRCASTAPVGSEVCQDKCETDRTKCESADICNT